MTPVETAWLTAAMMRSGVVADLASVRIPKVDKHSVWRRAVEGQGLPAPRAHDRGLWRGGADDQRPRPGGIPAATLDKLRVDRRLPGPALDRENPSRPGRSGLAARPPIGQTAELGPADKKLYALRDVTGTVDINPADLRASILCKKLAEGIDALVLNVTFGRGAFMAEKAARARELAIAMVGDRPRR